MIKFLYFIWGALKKRDDKTKILMMVFFCWCEYELFCAFLYFPNVLHWTCITFNYRVCQNTIAISCIQQEMEVGMGMLKLIFTECWLCGWHYFKQFTFNFSLYCNLTGEVLSSLSHKWRKLTPREINNFPEVEESASESSLPGLRACASTLSVFPS